jgi:hypothetical protein
MNEGGMYEPAETTSARSRLGCAIGINNFLAQFYRNEVRSAVGSERGTALALAREHAEKGKERAWCDGPPHGYKPALDEAERLLREIEHAKY